MGRFYFDQMGTFEFEGQQLDNIFVYYKVPDRFIQSEYFLPYFVGSSERIERVAEKVYGTDNLWWLILLFNKRIDPFYDWPMSNDELELWADKEATRLYGSYTPAQLTTVFEELFLENEQKRSINVLHKDMVVPVLEDISSFFANLG